MRVVVCLGGRFRGRATGYTRRDGFARRRVYRNEFFTIYSRGSIGTFAVARDECAGSVDGIGFTHAHTERGFGRPVDFVRSFVRSFVATRTRDDRRDDPITSITMDFVSIPFVAFRRRCSSRARSRPGRSIGRDAHVDALDDERHGRTRARDKPAANRDSDVWDRFGGSRFENLPPSFEELVGNLECVD